MLRNQGNRLELLILEAEPPLSTRDVTGQGIAIGTGAHASVTINEADKAHDVRGLAKPYLGLAAFTDAIRQRAEQVYV